MASRGVEGRWRLEEWKVQSQCIIQRNLNVSLNAI
jgi:hypothetical protein